MVKFIITFFMFFLLLFAIVTLFGCSPDISLTDRSNQSGSGSGKDGTSNGENKDSSSASSQKTGIPNEVLDGVWNNVLPGTDTTCLSIVFGASSYLTNDVYRSDGYYELEFLYYDSDKFQVTVKSGRVYTSDRNNWTFSDTKIYYNLKYDGEKFTSDDDDDFEFKIAFYINGIEEWNESKNLDLLGYEILMSLSMDVVPVNIPFFKVKNHEWAH